MRIWSSGGSVSLSSWGFRAWALGVNVLRVIGFFAGVQLMGLEFRFEGFGVEDVQHSNRYLP